eukprot:TRINITY_DN46437_c0_g1_i1.p1 TRINITY_DN46437_c0_g1~~TRINITY_DN46437_c0_g1_i1.p1  ORF type:complete len:218 (+),score=24.17 TRINITY_DN46437_c0_g1_i1:115-768(+)
MSSTKSVHFNAVAEVTDYGVEEDEEDTCDTWRDDQDDDTDDWSPRYESHDSNMSEMVAAVNRAKKLRASVEWDLKMSSQTEAQGGSKRAEHAPNAHRSTSLIGRIWRNFGALRDLGMCSKKGKCPGSKNAHTRRRCSIDLSQLKQRFMNSKAKEDASAPSFFGVGPSSSQASAVTDARRSSAPLTSRQSQQKRAFWFRTRVCPEVSPEDVEPCTEEK